MEREEKEIVASDDAIGLVLAVQWDSRTEQNSDSIIPQYLARRASIQM